jgi:hypothetical protein
LRTIPAREDLIQRRLIEWSHGVFAQTLGQRRGERAIEFSFPEKRFDGGSGGHIHLFAKLSLL